MSQGLQSTLAPSSEPLVEPYADLSIHIRDSAIGDISPLGLESLQVEKEAQQTTERNQPQEVAIGGCKTIGGNRHHTCLFI